MAFESATFTHLLAKAKRGDTAAQERLLDLVYRDLRRIAAKYMRNERPDHTLQPTALVHEMYMRAFQREDSDWSDRSHFFKSAATEMRHILVDHARRHASEKRGGEGIHVVLNEEIVGMSGAPENVLALDSAIERLRAAKPGAVDVVDLICFGGLTQDEAAEVLGCDVRTVKRRWKFAKGFLEMEIRGGRL
jgi:RNA polymerase sigma factor (TIGR02999 family)